MTLLLPICISVELYVIIRSFAIWIIYKHKRKIIFSTRSIKSIHKRMYFTACLGKRKGETVPFL